MQNIYLLSAMTGTNIMESVLILEHLIIPLLVMTSTWPSQSFKILKLINPHLVMYMLPSVKVQLLQLARLT
ncbi:hypothetical protein GcC1_002029 [Golovinomyces cichoracearum]|uniref:Uncharacterized protein n=1 Tax=Golovinomyces cichoracearum TaxID=62708 RepID=A0A420J9L1_9PEZI|nr:hypothetical protein GcC1_002029 [Golovinomyces cichoracearum]